MSTGLTMWPVRLKIFDDESLTSWLMRMAYEYGYPKAYIFCSIALERRIYPFLDLDVKLTNDDLVTLSGLSGQPLERIQQSTFNNFQGLFFHFTKNIKIWLDSRISPPPKRQRISICPTCLTSEDYEHPYLRKEWRLTYNTVCQQHKLKLIDMCPICFNHFHLTDHFIFNKNQQICLQCNTPIKEMKIPCLDPIFFHNIFIQKIKKGKVPIAYFHKLNCADTSSFRYQLEKKLKQLPDNGHLNRNEENIRLLAKCSHQKLGEIDIGPRHEFFRIAFHILEGTYEEQEKIEKAEAQAQAKRELRNMWLRNFVNLTNIPEYVFPDKKKK